MPRCSGVPVIRLGQTFTWGEATMATRISRYIRDGNLQAAQRCLCTPEGKNLERKMLAMRDRGQQIAVQELDAAKG